MQQRAAQGQRYKERAEECRRMAQTAPVHLKQKYLTLAESYDALDKYEDSRSLQSEDDKP